MIAEQTVVTLKITGDFETYSEADLKKVGAWIYSRHPSTDVLMLAYKIGKGKTKVWLPSPKVEHWGFKATPFPDDLREAIESGCIFEAHNAMFERCIWLNVLMRLYNAPEIKREQWRCSAAKAASYGLPRDLKGAGAAMQLEVQKDKEGRRLINYFCKPRKNGYPEKFTKTGKLAKAWEKRRDDFILFMGYCATDVDTEVELSDKLPDPPIEEIEAWQIDQDINLRGVLCDREMVRCALELTADKAIIVNKEMAEVTGGLVTSTTDRKGFLAWLSTIGVHLDDSKAETLEDWLEGAEDEGDLEEDFEGEEFPELAKRAIEIMVRANRTSTAKYRKMQERMDASDDRIRDILRFYGAEGTGRWSGQGVQFQNLPRGSIKDMEQAALIIKNSVTFNDDGTTSTELDALEFIYDDTMDFFSSAIRGCIIAPEGREFAVGDYSSVEARGTIWAAGDTQGLLIFGTGADIYCDMASVIFGYPVNKKDHPTERQFGKIAILGLGYSMGAKKFQEHCAKEGIIISFKEALRVVKLYRSRYPKIPELWKACEKAAIAAIKKPGSVVWAGKRIAYKRLGRFLFCRLPSGRMLAYPYPKVMQIKKLMPEKICEETGKTLSTKEVIQDQITYRKSTNKGFFVETTYGGKLVENAVQALCRDLMRDAMIRIHKHGKYEIVLTVHDELVSECDEGTYDQKEYEGLMAELPKWADGFPLAAEAWCGKRYKK